MRKRPLAIANEGSTSAFVSCSLRARFDGGSNTGVTVLVTNRGTASSMVTCTLVNGHAPPIGSESPVYSTQSKTITPNAYEVLEWWGWGVDALDLNLPNLNCQLPPGMEINGISLYTVE